jgi:hypothetical protein
MRNEDDEGNGISSGDMAVVASYCRREGNSATSSVGSAASQNSHVFGIPLVPLDDENLLDASRARRSIRSHYSIPTQTQTRRLGAHAVTCGVGDKL